MHILLHFTRRNLLINQSTFSIAKPIDWLTQCKSRLFSMSSRKKSTSKMCSYKNPSTFIFKNKIRWLNIVGWCDLKKKMYLRAHCGHIFDVDFFLGHHNCLHSFFKSRFNGIYIFFSFRLIEKLNLSYESAKKENVEKI